MPQKAASPKARRSAGERCYRFCYWLGIQLMRMHKRLRRRMRDALRSVKSRRLQRSSRRSDRFRRFLGDIRRAFTHPFREFSMHYHTQLSQFRDANGGQEPDGFRKANFMLVCCRPLVRFGVNYVFPLAAFVVLIASIHYYSGMNLALSVNYEGQSLGCIPTEAEFAQAQDIMKGQIITAENETPKVIIPTYSLVVADSEDYTDVETLTNRLITASGGELVEAAGFYLSDHFMGAVKDGDQLLNYLNYVLSMDETGADDETISFIKKMTLKKGLYPAESIRPLHELVRTLSGDEQVEKVYVIEAGDTPTGVASKNNMPYAELKSLNPDIETAAFFRVGNEVTISRPESYLATKVSRTEVYEEDIPFGTDSTPDNRYPEGKQVVVKAGIPGTQEVTANVTYIDGVEQSRTVIKTVKLSDPVNQQVLTGTMKPVHFVQGVDASASGFIWPVDWGFFNGSLDSYWGHTGMDIAGNYLAGVRASKTGTVVRAAWYGPYGKHVIIDHGGGVTTLYAHMNDIYVSVGQQVVQGELIGRVGRTGNTTGPHLHFEVRINGRYQDPVDYVGTYKR